jgi:dienelactone hydrolase
VLFPVAISYVVTHAARAKVPAADLGAPHEDVEFTTADGLRLKGWYIRSRNGAAVISFPGRASSQKRAKLLARHGYGVLLFDRRGEGESEGDPNLFGWQGERDIHAAVAFLQRRPDVDPERIGGIGLSVGGEMMIEAAAESPALKAIVSEGASGRSVRDDIVNGSDWQEVLATGIVTGATAVFANNLPPRTLKSLVPQISGATFFVYGEHGQPAEQPANRAFYAEARGHKEIWEVPGSKHIGGTEARPAEYERRVTAFFDRWLRPQN